MQVRSPPCAIYAQILTLLVALVSLWLALGHAHWTSVWMDREFQGWMIAVANRLRSGPPLYVDGTHSPMPPIPFILELAVSRGSGTWLTESALSFSAQGLLLLGMYFGLRSFAPDPVPFCATLASVPVIYALLKLAVHDSVAQCFAALASMAAARAVIHAGPERRWTRGAGLLCALCALSKQSTASGLFAGIVAAYLVVDRARPLRARVLRAASFIGWTVAFVTLLALALSPFISLGGLLSDVYRRGAEPKGGVREALTNLAGYARQLWPKLARYSLPAIGLSWLARRARASASEGALLLRARPLALATAFTALAMLALALAPRPSLHIPDALLWWSISPSALMWTGLLTCLWGTSWSLLRPSGSPRGWEAMVVILVPTAIAHNLSTAYLRWAYDNNPLVVAVVAWIVYDALSVTMFLGPRARLLAQIGVVSAVQICTWPVLQGQLRIARACTQAWPEVPQLQGARLRPRAHRMRTLVQVVRALTRRDDEVLLLPEDPNVEAWFERPRPRLTSAIVFNDQYWDRYVDDDFERLRRAPPKVIVVGPRNFSPRFQILKVQASGPWGANRLRERVVKELLPRSYRLEEAHAITYQDSEDFMDVYVRVDER